jgi:hypothetical protein
VGRHVAPLRHTNMISSHTVFALSHLCYVLSGEAVNNNCIRCLFDSMNLGFTRGEHANHYPTKAVFNDMKNNFVQIHNHNLINKLKLNIRCRNGRIVVGFNSTYSRHSYLHLIWAITIRAFGLWCDVLDSGIKHS